VLPLFSIALGAFAIGTEGFMLAGLLPATADGRRRLRRGGLSLGFVAGAFELLALAGLRRAPELAPAGTLV